MGDVPLDDSVMEKKGVKDYIRYLYRVTYANKESG